MLRFDTLAVAGFVRLANEMARARRAWKRGDSCGRFEMNGAPGAPDALGGGRRETRNASRR